MSQQRPGTWRHRDNASDGGGGWWVVLVLLPFVLWLIFD